MGFWGTKPCILHFLITGNTLLLASKTPTGFQSADLNSCNEGGDPVNRNNRVALGQSPGSPLRDIQSNIFELFCRYRTPHQVGEVNKTLPTNTEPPDLLEAEGGWYWLPFTSPPINQRTSTNWHAPPELKSPQPPSGRGTQFWGNWPAVVPFAW